jgi:hypothetical protein
MAFSNAKYTDISRSTFNDVGRDQIITQVFQINISLFGSRQSPPGHVHHKGSKALAGPSLAPVTLSPNAPASPSHLPESISEVVDITASLIVQILNLLITPGQSMTNNQRDLRLELKTLHQSIMLTRHAIQEYENRHLGQSLIHAVTPEVDRCRVVLQELFDRVNGTWKGLDSTCIRDFWRQVWWGRWDGDEMALLKDQLSGSRKLLLGFLRALNSYVVFGCSHNAPTEISFVMINLKALCGWSWETTCAQAIYHSPSFIPC